MAYLYRIPNIGGCKKGGSPHHQNLYSMKRQVLTTISLIIAMFFFLEQASYGLVSSPSCSVKNTILRVNMLSSNGNAKGQNRLASGLKLMTPQNARDDSVLIENDTTIASQENITEKFSLTINGQLYEGNIEYVFTREPISTFVRIDQIGAGNFKVTIGDVDPKNTWSREMAVYITRQTVKLGVPLHALEYQKLRTDILWSVHHLLRDRYGYSDQTMEWFYKQNTFSAMQNMVRRLLSGQENFPAPFYQAKEHADIATHPEYSELQTFGALYARMILFLSAQKNITSAADFGFGQGTFLSVLQEHMPDVALFGYDADPLYFGYDFVGYLREIAPDITVEISDLGSPENPVWEKEFDVVTVNHVLEHIAHSPDDTVEHLKRWNHVAQKYLVVSIPFEGEAPLSPNHTIAFSKTEFRALCEKVAEEIGCDLVLDMLDWGIVVFDHTAQQQAMYDDAGEKGFFRV